MIEIVAVMTCDHEGCTETVSAPLDEGRKRRTLYRAASAAGWSARSDRHLCKAHAPVKEEAAAE
jgi:hypothetical protein